MAQSGRQRGHAAVLEGMNALPHGPLKDVGRTDAAYEKVRFPAERAEGTCVGDPVLGAQRKGFAALLAERRLNPRSRLQAWITQKAPGPAASHAFRGEDQVQKGLTEISDWAISDWVIGHWAIRSLSHSIVGALGDYLADRANTTSRPPITQSLNYQ